VYVAEKEGIYDGTLMEALAREWRLWRVNGGFGAAYGRRLHAVDYSA